MTITAIDALKHHILTLEYDDLPESTVNAAKAFIFDSIGVGLSGSRVKRVEQVIHAVQLEGEAKQAQVWTTGQWLNSGAAALVNGYQIHNQEWDCVHEAAVVHPMATILSAMMAIGQQYAVSGKQLILGVVVAVDVATLIGQSVTSGLRFFRPSMCGSLGVAAGICAMLGESEDVLTNALGITYSKLSGTMQAHVEGSPTLALQIGLNAQSAIQAYNLAKAGFEGPKDILEGPYGYFNLIEESYDLSPFWHKLGKEFQIEQVSHKPFPTGRAGHGTVDGICQLMKLHAISPNDIVAITVTAPPLIHRLVGRPAIANMDANYAKLCNGYIAATAVLTGTVTVEDFSPECLNDSSRLSLANKVTTLVNDVSDPNALAPITVQIKMLDDTVYGIDLPQVLGHPKRPLSIDAQRAKFISACHSAKYRYSTAQIDKLINGIDQLTHLSNINSLIQLMINTDSNH
ncbi:MmgE/PrpD family protein [Thalassotalea sp. M1531]|uniref:MmgE/PrpD family protein n=1 Tax=Thalassotalea algicola TaxID=2716224 RepID=A0A7Y0L9U1_9GAMM|nr:MmgE/PrpD family protein [Thalassotalea algicola]NMP30132.1 MmgE/PrpD family protein [Thalassotalea algicola]